MGLEYIKSIAITEDGVYLSSKSVNDSVPYRSVRRIDSLSDVYDKEGQKGLDREIIKMLYSYAELTGHHPSLDRYYFAMAKARDNDIYNYYLDKVNAKYRELSEDDARSLHRGKPTEKAKEYSVYDKAQREEMYNLISEFCSEYENSVGLNKEMVITDSITKYIAIISIM